MVLVGFPRRSICSIKCLLVQAANLALALLAVTLFWIIVNGDKEAVRQLTEHSGSSGNVMIQQQLEQELAARKQQLQDEICRARQHQKHAKQLQQQVHVDSSGHVIVGKAPTARPSKKAKQEGKLKGKKSKKKGKRNKQAKLT